MEQSCRAPIDVAAGIADGDRHDRSLRIDTRSIRQQRRVVHAQVPVAPHAAEAVGERNRYIRGNSRRVARGAGGVFDPPGGELGQLVFGFFKEQAIERQLAAIGGDGEGVGSDRGEGQADRRMDAGGRGGRHRARRRLVSRVAVPRRAVVSAATFYSLKSV